MIRRKNLQRREQTQGRNHGVLSRFAALFFAVLLLTTSVWGAESSTEAVLAGAGGRDVTIHFGEDGQEIHLRVNPEAETLPETEAEETGADFSAETEAETESTEDKRVYEYEDSKVRVIATLQVADAVPDEAEFRVTELTPDSAAYNYDAYLDALNENSDALAQQEGAASADSSGLKATGKTYTERNTLLYDVAFIMCEHDEDGNAIEGTEYEYQPAQGSVDIRIEFKDSQLTDELGITDESDVAITHLPLQEKVKTQVDSTADAVDITSDDIRVESIPAEDVSLADGATDSADFTMDSFSVIAVSGGSTQNLEAVGFPLVTTQGIVNDSLNFGVTANDWYFDNGDSETSLAVGTWHGSGGQTGSNESKSQGAECQYILVGEVDSWLHLKGYTAYITSPYTSEDQKISYGTDFYDSRLIFTQQDGDSIKQEVRKMIADAARVSAALAASGNDSIQDYSNVPQGDSAGKLTLDFTNLPDDQTYYINVENWLFEGWYWDSTDYTSKYGTFNPLKNALAYSGTLTINKKDGQKIVFNYPTSTTAQIGKYTVINDGVTYDAERLANMTTAQCDVLEDLIFNFPNAAQVTLETTAGIFLAPGAQVDVYGVGGGWVICDQFYNHCEWHFTYDGVRVQGSSAKLKAVKTVDGADTVPSGFRFKLEEKNGSSWQQLGDTVENDGSSISFPTVYYNEDNCSESRDFFYRISETGEVTSLGGQDYETDETVYYARVHVNIVQSGQTVTYVASEPEYFTDEACTKAVSSADGLPVFHNTQKRTEIGVEKVWSDGNDAHDGDSVAIELHKVLTPAVSGETAARTGSASGMASGLAAELEAEDADRTGSGEAVTLRVLARNSSWEEKTSKTVTGTLSGGDVFDLRLRFTGSGSGDLTAPIVIYCWSGVTFQDGSGFNDIRIVPAYSETKDGVKIYEYTFRGLVAPDWDIDVTAIMPDAYAALKSIKATVTASGHTSASDPTAETTAQETQTPSSGETNGSGENTGLVEDGSENTSNGGSGGDSSGQQSGETGQTEAVVTDAVVRTITLDKSNGWKETLDDLPLTETHNGVVYDCTYYAVETNPKSGYTVTCTSGDAATAISAGTITVTNTKETGSLVLRKRSTGHDTPPNTLFTVRSLDGSVIAQVHYSEFAVPEDSGDNVPIYTISGLEAGEYSVSEKTDAVEDGAMNIQENTNAIYSLLVTYSTEDGNTSHDSGSVEVPAGGTAAIDITNKYTTSYTMPATGGRGTTALYLTGLFLILLAGAGWALRRRRYL